MAGRNSPEGLFYPISISARKRNFFFKPFFPLVSRYVRKRNDRDDLRNRYYDIIHELTASINSHRSTPRFQKIFAKSSYIFSIGIIHNVYAYIFDHLINASTKDVLLSPEDRTKLLSLFSGIFAPDKNYYDLFQGKTPDKNWSDFPAKDIFLVWIMNRNPAVEEYKDLFDLHELNDSTELGKLIDALRNIRPDTTLTNKKSNLVDLLLEPFIKYPNDLHAQLVCIRQLWNDLPDIFDLLLLYAMDFIKEEARLFAPGPGSPVVLKFDESSEPVNFTDDREWMPKVVLLAKNILVWFDQLSRSYNREIRKLDLIPDEELMIIRNRGINALWLIGIWERSPASKTIKQRCGNPEAEASAYSIYDYDISGAIGGWEALHLLKTKCDRLGIRLACDMVPNHTGIISKWVLERPSWFIQSGSPPFPDYQYQSENLSPDPAVSIIIEDHYYSRSDAAVTFKRVDHGTGQTAYIYHGNDGTHMPWNDTAQLNFLVPDVRKALTEKILALSRVFPVIRFDAAMTLVKRHIQRLWFPEPGRGGDIPSRSRYSMNASEFERKIPTEFWKDVVDTINRENPETLLIAEAFWMMEGYFVRTLGMHRVYNSAFMNMLKSEENAKYRETIKNVLSFDPEILKRFVNFMNNPDEETAAAQFGKGDKYFGVFTLMVTMPGLPMIGHGQIEGFTEKYGMEYSKAYKNEEPDRDMLARHETDIFPLLRKRALFANVENFRIFDFMVPDDGINENVFAYVNRGQNDMSLVLYNNAYESTSGRIHVSVPFKEKSGESTVASFAAYAGIDGYSDGYISFKNYIRGKWHLVSVRDISGRGLFQTLRGYEYKVFLNFQYHHPDAIIDDIYGRYGTAEIDDFDREFRFAKTHQYREHLDIESLAEAENHDVFLNKLGWHHNVRQAALSRRYYSSLRKAVTVFENVSCRDESLNLVSGYIKRSMRIIPHYAQISKILFVLQVLDNFYGLISLSGKKTSVIEELFLEEKIMLACPDRNHEYLTLFKILLTLADWYKPDSHIGTLLSLFKDERIQSFINVNFHAGVYWFVDEKVDELIWWLFRAAAVQVIAEDETARLQSLFTLLSDFVRQKEKSHYSYLHLVGEN